MVAKSFCGQREFTIEDHSKCEYPIDVKGNSSAQRCIVCVFVNVCVCTFFGGENGITTSKFNQSNN